MSRTISISNLNTGDLQNNRDSQKRTKPFLDRGFSNGGKVTRAASVTPA